MGPRLPFRPFAHERLVLALVALAALTIVQVPNTQDETRLSLTQAIVEHGELTIDRYGVPLDRASYAGSLYTDKAPGLSFLAVPVVAAVRAGERLVGSRSALLWEAQRKLWLVRVVVLGPFLLLLTWLLGRVAEGLATGTGAATAVTCALGTMLGALSSVLFAHVVVACLCFAAFVVLARSRRPWPVAAGALVGVAVLVDYQAALVAGVLAVYALLTLGIAAAAWYVAGGVPAILVLGAYNWVAFESPFHLSYRYKSGSFEDEQHAGLFGIGAPRLDSAAATLFGEHGLLLVSPVLVAAAFGLVLLWRDGFRAEAAAAVAIVLVSLLLEAGYFLPLGGVSPGPRFFAPALPFLLLGLPMALTAAPGLVAGLIGISVGIATVNALTWFTTGDFFTLPQTIWAAGPLPALPSVLVVSAAAATATAIALRHHRRVSKAATV